MESIFDEIDSKRIAPQRFSLAVFYCVCYIVLTYVYVLLGDKGQDIIYLFDEIIGLLILFSFKKYLQNFDYGKTIFWTNFRIVACFAELPLLVIFAFYKVIDIQPELYHTLLFTASLLYLLLMIINFVGLIASGLAYRQLEHEPTELVSRLGVVLAFVVPLPYLVLTVYLAIHAKHPETTVQSVLIKFLLSTLLLIPSFILVVMFYRAKKIASTTIQ